MTKTQQDWEMWTGEDKSLVYTIVDGNSASVDMSGAAAAWILEDEPNSGSMLRFATGGSGITVAGCTVTVAIDTTDTSGCNMDGTFYSVLTACDVSGNVAVLAVGYAEIHKR